MKFSLISWSQPLPVREVGLNMSSLTGANSSPNIPSLGSPVDVAMLALIPYVRISLGFELIEHTIIWIQCFSKD